MRTKVLALFGSLVLAGGIVQPAAGGNTGSIGTMTGMPVALAQNPASPGLDATNDGAGSSSAVSPAMSDGKPIAYHDAQRGFMMVAPPGARFQERADGAQIGIQSRKGYAVNVQAGDANPAVTTPQMFAKMEVKYLGTGKPWARKVDESETIIAGLPAGLATYESASSRSRVVIARGQKTDFVFIFFAPFTHYEKLHSEFEWILASFRPDPGELPKEPVKIVEKIEPPRAEPPLRAQSVPEMNPTGRPLIEIPASISADQVFAEAGYGYRVEYPTGWMLEKVSAFTNVISGPPGTPAYDAIVAVQNVKPESDGATSEVARIAFDDLKAMLAKSAQHVDFVGEKSVTYAKYGVTLEGRQFVASYDHDGRRFRKWALVLPRPEGGVAHIWSYTAPVEQFDAYRPVAERILNSLKIDGGQG